MACLLIYTNDLKIPFPMLLYDCQCASDWTKYFFCLRKWSIFIFKMHVWIFTQKIKNIWLKHTNKREQKYKESNVIKSFNYPL